MKFESHITAALAAFALATTACGARAGQVDAGTYVLTYADALGVPTVSTVGDSTAYTFATFVLGDSGSEFPHGYATEQGAGPVVVTAASGFRIAARPDVTFPVVGELQVTAADPAMLAWGTARTTAKSAYLSYFERWSVQPEYGDRSVYRNLSGKVLPGSYTDEAGISFIASALAVDYWGAASFRPVVYVDSRYITTAVPEPGSAALMLAGLAALFGGRRRSASVT